MNASEHVLKVAGKVELSPEQAAKLKLGVDVEYVFVGTITAITEKDNMDGTKGIMYRYDILGMPE
jgi:hypothetical protein